MTKPVDPILCPVCGEEIGELPDICNHWDCFVDKDKKFCAQCKKEMGCDAVHASFGYGSGFDEHEMDWCSDLCFRKWVCSNISKTGYVKPLPVCVHYARYSDIKRIFFVPCLEIQSTVPKYGCDGVLYYSNHLPDVTCEICLDKIRKRKSAVNACSEDAWVSWRKYQKARGLGECGEELK